ncbi:ergothioneine biosynthesis protein EgtC [Streptacidiphilus sp. N1-12]|uniref:Ergothioneine biosynthesis protein EgtC n=2 Tax=Streptacidiphilus alkalitolerans TaxID=3342712 RepID=A0ABV6WH51_9ACTN
MCRHLASLGPVRPLAELLADRPGSLYRQSWAPRRQTHGTVNADGFGIGWYPPGAEDAPARYRRAVPIWADTELPDLARTLHSAAVLAAVRDATAGTSQDAAACAPFRTGRWLFSHNGAIADWRRLPEEIDSGLSASALLGLEASCDSALLWALLHRRLDTGEPPGEALAAVTRQVAAVRPQARLNLLLTDGRTIGAIRWGDTLSWRAGTDRVLVASEPCDESDGWQDVPEHSLLLATRDQVRITPIPLPSPQSPGVEQEQSHDIRLHA